MTDRPDIYPDHAMTDDTYVSSPISSVRTQGYPPGSKGIARWQNFQMRGAASWLRYLDETHLAPGDLFTSNALVSSAALSFPIGTTLSPSPNAGATYILNGVRVDFPTALLATTWPEGALVWAANTTNYVHARARPLELAARSIGDLLVNTNPVAPAGYVTILSGTTNGTGITALTPLVGKALVFPFALSGITNLEVDGTATFHDDVDMDGGRLLINDAANETALSVFSAAAGFNKALLVTCTGGGTAIAASIQNNSAKAFETATGTGAAACGYYVEMNNTPAGGSGVRVEVISGAAVGLRINHAGSGPGILLNHTGTGQAFTLVGSASTTAVSFAGGAAQIALQTTSGNNATAAHYALGVGTAMGIDAVGGSGSAAAIALRATAQHANSYGVHGRSHNVAGAGAGVYAEGRGTGQVGLFAESPNGHAAIFFGDTTNPAYPLARWVPQNADPTSSTQNGDFTFGLQNQFRFCVAGHGYKPIMSMPTTGSAVIGYGTQPYNTTINYGGTLATIVSAHCLASQGNGFYSSSLGHTVRIRFTADVRTGVAAADYANVQIQDFTTGVAVVIATWSGAGTAANSGFALPMATTDWQRAIIAEVEYSPVSDGDLIIRVQMSRVTNNQFVRNARVEVIGAFGT